ncbi:hypothetical protein, partial [Thermoflexus hugenholtzii]
GITDCQRFVSEVRCLIEGVREARQCNGWLRAVSEEALVLDLLAWYYFLKFAYHIGGPIVQWWHKEREIRDQLQPALDHIW